MLPPGTRLGSYEILSLLGAGGMGEVYRARDTRLERPVAINVLKPELAGDPQFRDRFEREARTVSRLDHPHICALFDVGQSGDLSYLVMPQLEGTTLEDRLRSGPVPVDTAVTIARQIADALAAAHRAGIVHRDIKPGNIFLTRADHRGAQAKLLDFGIAKPVAITESNMTVMETGAGMTVGTAAYMSPEQSRGEDVDERADVFSLGVVLYEMLTGKRPALDAVPPGVASSLQRVVTRCLQPLPRDRFPGMGDVLEALSAERPAEESPSIAVLPFARMSADPDNEYFGDGLAEEVLNALTRVSGLKVIARTSAFAFKGKHVDIRTIAEALGVSTVLEGSVRRAGSRIRVTAQLITAADGSHLWSERYDRQMTEIVDVQDDIAQALTRALALTLAPRLAAPARGQHSAEAYEEYLRGRQNLYRLTREAWAAAYASFERARTLDRT